ncbi:hypothetical protein K8R62_00770 [bacterium]|nr:hypothetical protein [bacterium]
MKIFKNIFFILFYFIISIFFNPITVQAGDNPVDSLFGLTTTNVGGISKDSLPTMIGRIVGALLSFVGVIFLILMIYGGIMWMTARGNEQQVEKARSLIIAAIIGIIITLAAYAITIFVGNILTA